MSAVRDQPPVLGRGGYEADGRQLCGLTLQMSPVVAVVATALNQQDERGFFDHRGWVKQVES
ncbi:MAG: hypothetical protein WD766_09320 [Gemmatimonadota bacterium]